MKPEVSDLQNTLETTNKPTPAEEYGMAKLFLDRLDGGKCRKCYGRRYIGYNQTTKQVVKCDCLIKLERKVELLNRQRKPQDETVSPV